MKKTIIALIALSGLAGAYDAKDNGMKYNATDKDFSLTLYSSASTLSTSTLTTIATTDLSKYVEGQDFISVVGSDKSPGLFSVSFSLTLTSLTSTGNIFTITSDGPWDSRGGGNKTSDKVGYGLYLDSNGALTFNRSDVTATYAVTMDDSKTVVATLGADKTYDIVLTSYAKPDASSKVGRASDNFYISVTPQGGTATTMNLAGFGLNAEDGLGAVVIGSANGVAGSISNLTIKSVPEPTTATLSLLALAGLVARRRRK